MVHKESWEECGKYFILRGEINPASAPLIQLKSYFYGFTNSLKVLESLEDPLKQAKRKAQELSDSVLTGISALQTQRDKAARNAARAYVEYQKAQQVVATYDAAIAETMAQITGQKRRNPLFMGV